MSTGRNALSDAVGLDAMEFLKDTPYPAAIEKAIKEDGMTPEEVNDYLRKELGPYREALVYRCRQVADYIYSRFLEEDTIPIRDASNRPSDVTVEKWLDGANKMLDKQFPHRTANLRTRAGGEE